MNINNSKMMIDFLRFSTQVNKVSTVREKLREKNIYDSEDSLDEFDFKESEKEHAKLHAKDKKIDESDQEIFFTSLFDPFGNCIRMAELTVSQYMSKYFKPRSKAGFSDDEKKRYKNCIVFSFDHGISVSTIEYDKILKTILYKPKVSKNCIFVSKINTYALCKTSTGGFHEV